jgi:hypothetical protein
MLIITWAILNVAIFIFFLVRLNKLSAGIRRKKGMGNMLLFLGVVFCAIPGNLKQHKHQTKDWQFAKRENLQPNKGGMISAVIGKTSLFRYNLTIGYGLDKASGKRLPEDASAHSTGIYAGTQWRPTHIWVKPTASNDRFYYEVFSELKWSLLGITLYTEDLTHKGFIEINQKNGVIFE